MTPRDKLAATIAARPLPLLLDSFATLEAVGALTDAEKLIRAMIMDELCIRSDAVNAACEKWDTDDDDPRTLGQVILDAARELA